MARSNLRASLFSAQVYAPMMDRSVVESGGGDDDESIPRAGSVLARVHSKRTDDGSVVESGGGDHFSASGPGESRVAEEEVGAKGGLVK